MTTDPRTILKDAGYIAVGLGVIAFQRAQVRRRELEQQLADVSTTVEAQRKLVEERLEALGGQLESTLTELQTTFTQTLDDLRSRVPESALEAFDTAVGAAKDGVAQVLDLVKPNTSASQAA